MGISAEDWKRFARKRIESGDMPDEEWAAVLDALKESHGVEGIGLFDDEVWKLWDAKQEEDRRLAELEERDKFLRQRFRDVLGDHVSGHSWEEIWEEVRRVKTGRREMTQEEGQKAYEESKAEPTPISKERIKEMVRHAVDNEENQ